MGRRTPGHQRADGITGVKAQDNPLFPLALLAMVAGPCVTGVVLTGLIEGRTGLRELRSRLLTWRVGARWYAVALLAAPLLATGITLTLSLFSPAFRPGLVVTDDKTAVLLLGLAIGVTAGFFEELGWTGFAIPRLKVRYGIVATGLIVGGAESDQFGVCQLRIARRACKRRGHMYHSYIWRSYHQTIRP